MGLRHAYRCTESQGKRLLFLLDNMALAAVVLQISTTLVARSVSSLLTRSTSLSADGSCLVQNSTVPRIHSDVDQCGTAASESTPDSELFTVLSAEAGQAAGEEAQPRMLSRIHSCAGVAGLSQKKTAAGPTSKRGKRSSTNSGSRCSGKPVCAATPSSVSCPTSSGAEAPQRRLSATRSRLTSF